MSLFMNPLLYLHLLYDIQFIPYYHILNYFLYHDIYNHKHILNPILHLVVMHQFLPSLQVLIS